MKNKNIYITQEPKAYFPCIPRFVNSSDNWWMADGELASQSRKYGVHTLSGMSADRDMRSNRETFTLRANYRQ